MNKYTYYKIIQTNWGDGWNDDDWHETDSQGHPKDRKHFLGNVRDYRVNCFGISGVRIVRRRERNEEGD